MDVARVNINDKLLSLIMVAFCYVDGYAVLPWPSYREDVVTVRVRLT